METTLACLKFDCLFSVSQSLLFTCESFKSVRRDNTCKSSKYIVIEKLDEVIIIHIIRY